jgi:outer membrane receptor for ferrienterochelin and colicins
MNVYQVNDVNGSMEKSRQLFAPKWSGNFVAGYTFPGQFTIDLTGQWNGSMRLPLQPKDYRAEYSPWFCLANVQVTKKINQQFEIYGGVKNIFNFIPKDVLMRPFDPFDKHINDPVNNPNGYTFDTEYNYAPLQGVKGFVGVRLVI